MNKEEIFIKLKEIFATINPNTDTDLITIKSHLNNDLNMTSLSMVYILVALENEFDIDMSDVSFDTFKTVEDVINYILNNI